MSCDIRILCVAVLIILCTETQAACDIPVIIRGSWFSYEDGRNTHTVFDAISMNKIPCLEMSSEHKVQYSFLFKEQSSQCYICSTVFVRTINVLQKVQSSCVTWDQPREPSVTEICLQTSEQDIVTLFKESYTPLNCRSSIEGVWQFAYRNKYTSAGECSHPDAYIKSCQQAGNQFSITNQKFNISYKRCPSMQDTFDAVVEYSCLGDWYVDKNHFFAVANTKESREDEKYRCFLTNRDDDLLIGVSNTPECNQLKTVEESPERLRVTPVKTEVVEPCCRLPQNFTGNWVNPANLEAEVFINETHIIETWHPDQGRFRRTIYACKQIRGQLVMMTRLTVDGCQKDYVCFEFIPRHHNIIRYRRGTALGLDDFSTVCSYVQFTSEAAWKYDFFVAASPTPVRCPVAGKFNFTQKAEVPFETKIIGGVTISPRPNTYCKETISDLSVCDADQKQMNIDEKYCLSVDHLGRPVDIYSDPDYQMKCIGYWKENLKSYLITYNELDSVSKYKCWVYQRADLNRVLMSQSVGPTCALNQDVTSWNYSEGAAVAIDMFEYERERDQCPMFFDDGSNPWLDVEGAVQLIRFSKAQLVTFSWSLLIVSFLSQFFV